MLNLISKSKYFLIASSIIIISCILFIIIFGLNFGIDFKGGSLIKIKFSNYIPKFEDIKAEVLKETKFADIRKAEDKSVIIKTTEITEIQKNKIVENLQKLDEKNKIEIESFESIGPAIGNELKRKTIIAVSIVVILIILYIAFAFRKAKIPSPFYYGISAIIALIHDLIVTLGIFAILGKFFNAPINAPFIAAMLTILGYSVNDTIVVFDRIRENLKKYSYDFSIIVNKSINETITRSLNTSLTTLFVLLAIFIFGGSNIRFFVLALIIGIISGTYSSIFIASPILLKFKK